MKVQIFSAVLIGTVLSASAENTASAVTAETIRLPEVAVCVKETAVKPLMQLLSERKSGRAYDSRELSREMLSGVLWAAAGINRPDGKRTAGSTMNWKAVEVYAVLNSGIYFYNAKENTLEPVASGNYQALTGMQPFAAKAPLNLLYVGDTKKMAIEDPSRKYLMLGTDLGLMSQNVYLYAADKGLATVIRGSVEHAPLAKIMNLPPEKEILMAQTVGYPAAENK